MRARAFQKSRREFALTLTEFLVILGILCALIFFTSIPRFDSGELSKGQMLQTLSNMRQLHLAAQTMALDGTTTGDTNLRWPGDADGSYESLAKNLVPAYLTTNDFAKLLSAPGRNQALDRIPKASDAAVLFYAVREKDPTNAVFLTTANFTNTPGGGTPLEPGSVPFGAKGFVVFRKDGSGAILLPRQVGQTNVIGACAPLCE